MPDKPLWYEDQHKTLCSALEDALKEHHLAWADLEAVTIAQQGVVRDKDLAKSILSQIILADPSHPPFYAYTQGRIFYLARSNQGRDDFEYRVDSFPRNPTGKETPRYAE